MSTKDRILEDVKVAMRARNRERLGALRLVTAAIKQREIDERVTLDDAGVLAVLDKMLKQRLDSREQYAAAGREDLAGQEDFEIRLIREYLPEPLSEEAVREQIELAVTEAGAAGPRDMGKVMGLLKPRVQGRADMKAVSALVKERLSG